MSEVVRRFEHLAKQDYGWLRNILAYPFNQNDYIFFKINMGSNMIIKNKTLALLKVRLGSHK